MLPAITKNKKKDCAKDKRDVNRLTYALEAIETDDNGEFREDLKTQIVT
jgi:hypothetical protein